MGVSSLCFVRMCALGTQDMLDPDVTVTSGVEEGGSLKQGGRWEASARWYFPSD